METNPAISIEQLNRYLDGELTEKDRTAVEAQLQADSALQSRLENLLIARKAIHAAGLKDRIAGIYSEFRSELTPKLVPLAKRRTVKTWMAAAAAALLIVTGYSAYRFTTLSNHAVFDQHYIAYYLPVQRGSNDTASSVKDSLYRAGDYTGFLAMSKNMAAPMQKDYFLQGMALLETGEPVKAIAAFEQLRQLNAASNERYFEQETDYYLTLALIRSGRITEARALLRAIDDNPGHLYHKNAAAISKWTLRALELKN